MACVVWVSCAILLYIRRKNLAYGLGKIGEGLFGKPI